MSQRMLARRWFLQALAVSGAGAVAWAAEPAREGLKEPVFRVSKANSSDSRPADQHPLDPALKIARDGLSHIQQNILDYTCTVIKRERIKGQLGDYEYMFAKIRNRKVADGKLATPLSVYLNFLKPDNIKGREVVWVEGRNNNKLRAHEGGVLGSRLPSVWLDPNSALAMRNQLYPITEIGVENLVAKLIEKGERDRSRSEVEVEFIDGAKINGVVCTLLQVKHPVQRDYFDFYLAQVFIDKQNNVPIRYAAYGWPAQEGAQPPVLEEYTYVNMKFNVGLTDADFDPENPDYRF